MKYYLPKDIVERILDFITYYREQYDKVILEMKSYDLFLPLILLQHSPVDYSLKCISIVEEYDIYTN
tara:strand:+ start:264 stop:464 length:201 start_codon:yes stop_codon:yes gene_type:complete